MSGSAGRESDGAIHGIAHVAIAVRDADAVAERFVAAFGAVRGGEEALDGGALRVLFLHLGPVTLELLEPRSPDHTVARFLAARGPGLHHVSLEVDDVAKALARARGLDLERIARRLSFFFNAHNHLFEEVAKFRAARKLWAELLEERFAIRDADARRMRFHTQTAGSMLTAQQPLNNVVRTTVQGLAAVLGGTQSLHTNSYDEALGLPSESAALLALRTQQVLAHESGVAEVADPLAGSYLVEALTAELERRARDLLARIDAMGGMLRAIEHGFVQDEIHRSAYRWQREVESGERVVVGVNRYVEGAAASPSFRHDPAVEPASRMW